MSEPPNLAAAAMSAQLTDEQVNILAALEPHESASFLLIAEVTTINTGDLERQIADLQSAGLVAVDNEPQYSTRHISATLTASGRFIIEHRLAQAQPPSGLMRAFGFSSRPGGGG